MTTDASPAALNTSVRPLEPLTAAEISTAREVLDRAGVLRQTTRFSLVQLEEPDKVAVLAHAPARRPVDRPCPRTVLLDTDTGAAEEVVVSVTRRTLLCRTVVDAASPPYGQPTLLIEDAARIVDIVSADPRWKSAMAARGITDTQHCVVLPLAPGIRPPRRGREEDRPRLDALP